MEGLKEGKMEGLKEGRVNVLLIESIRKDISNERIKFF